MAILSLLVGCREVQVSNDSSLRLSFSCDTLRFDTVFTEQGSATAQVMVYNRNKNAVLVDRVWLDKGTFFRANVDGEADLSRLTDLQINGGDSVFVFVRVDIDPTDSNSPVLVTDLLHFHLSNGISQYINLEAYGQDVIRIGHRDCARTDTFNITFKADKPYLIYDTLVVGGTLKMQAGATIYMHSGASIFALGNVKAEGTLAQPIVLRGDRLDYLFEHVPYLYAGGSWNGFYLQADKKQTYDFHYVDILSANVGLYCLGTQNAMSSLRMDGCRIHNHSLYGLVLLNTNALVTNTEISNCASYCVYCSGGTQRFIHTTVASYFGATDIRIQSAVKEDASAVYIDDLDKTNRTKTSFINSIVTGYQQNQLVLATPFEQYYEGEFTGDYIGQDTAKLFRNTYYKYKEYVYYDFQLDSLSAAIGLGDSLAAIPYPYDRLGVSREGLKPDAGCYQHQP